MLEIGSAIVQVVLGVFSIYVGWRLKPIRGYFWPLIIGGVAVLIAGIGGLLFIYLYGDILVFIRYRRPLFIIERVCSGLVFFNLLVRNLRLAAMTRDPTDE